MGKAPPSLKNARILVSNDDGINAPGLVLSAVSTGAISVTPLDLDLTDGKMVRTLKKAFA